MQMKPYFKIRPYLWFLLTVIFIPIFPILPAYDIVIGSPVAHASMLDALLMYEKGVKMLELGSCKRSIEFFSNAVKEEPQDRTVRIGMYTYEYFPNRKTFEAQMQCGSPVIAVGLSPENPAISKSSKESEAIKSHDVADGKDTNAKNMKKEIPEPVFTFSIEGFPVTPDVNDSFSVSIPVPVSKQALFLEASRSYGGKGDRKTVSVALPIPVYVDNTSKSSTVSSVHLAGFIKHESTNGFQITINHFTLSHADKIVIESHLPTIVNVKF
ncbi:MAG: hypothetical protein HQK89_07845 [Nitrospirae bacterium]|nr:hypothetical protein [Nitrospirota bacterium]